MGLGIILDLRFAIRGLRDSRTWRGAVLADAQFQSGRGLPQSTTWRSGEQALGLGAGLRLRLRTAADATPADAFDVC